MPASYSGNNTISDGPFDLPLDGESVNHDALMQSGTAAKGLIGKLLNAISWLKKRRAIYVSYSTNGSGAVTISAVSKGNDGVTADVTAAIVGSDVVLTFATALPSAAYVVAYGGATIGFGAHAVTKAAGSCTITVSNGAGTGINQSSTIVQVDLVIFHPG
jgi:hypothetical protein